MMEASSAQAAIADFASPLLNPSMNWCTGFMTSLGSEANAAPANSRMSVTADSTLIEMVRIVCLAPVMFWEEQDFITGTQVVDIKTSWTSSGRNQTCARSGSGTLYG